MAILENACLEGTNFHGTILTEARLNRAWLIGADLSETTLVYTDCEDADLTGARVYGISAWDTILTNAKQSGLIITRADQPNVTVDDLEVAQFIYLILRNEKLRHIIEVITSKVVLILGRFTPARMSVLQGLRETLRAHDYTPVVFDFAKPAGRDLTETISTLAHMARFVIADITDAKSIPQELDRIVPNLPSVPVQPLLLAGAQEYALFEHLRRYPWVLREFVYNNQEHLLASINKRVINPAERKVRTLRRSQESGR